MMKTILLLFVLAVMILFSGCAGFNGQVREGHSFRGVFGEYIIYVDGGITQKDYAATAALVRRAEKAFLATEGERSPYYYHSINFVDTTNFLRRYTEGGRELQGYVRGPVIFIHAPTPLFGKTPIADNNYDIVLLHELHHCWSGGLNEEWKSDAFVDQVPL